MASQARSSTSNTLDFWELVKAGLPEGVEVQEVCLQNGTLADCIGCSYKTCMHFGQQGGCFYGGPMVAGGGVEGQDAARGRQSLPGEQALHQLRRGEAEGGGLVGALGLGLNPEVAQGAGGLHQGPAQEGAPGEIGREHQVPRHVLGVELPHAGDHQGGETALQQSAVQPEDGEHPVIGQVAPGIEYGRSTPSSATLLALAEYFNVSADYLLGRTDLPTAAKNFVN